VTHLRKIMLEELQRRHYSEATTRYYILKVEAFARYFQCAPDRLGRQHVREYQAYLFSKRKLSPGSVTNHLCALRCFLHSDTEETVEHYRHSLPSTFTLRLLSTIHL
jgi:hypothetical protein